jgi:hypothetical protein
MKNVTLVAGDYMESGTLRGLARMLAPFASVRTYLGDGWTPGQASPLPFDEDDMLRSVRESALVVVTASNHRTQILKAANAAVEAAIPLVIVGLGFGAWSHADWSPVRSFTKGFFVANEREASRAREFFPNARIIAAGEPEHEEYFFPRFAREEVRRRLRVDDGTKLVLVAGDKDVTTDFALFVNVIEAMRDAKRIERKIVFALHPGHIPVPGQKSRDDLIRFFESALVRYSHGVDPVVTCGATPFGFSASEMMPGMDLVIGVGSSLLIQAAHLRIPAIAMLIAGAFDRQQELGPDRRTWWPPVEDGAVAGITDMSIVRMRDAIDELSEHSDARRRLRERQAEVYPMIERSGVSYQRMIEALLPYLRD